MKVYLETERLTLREFTEDDAGLLVALDSDPEVMRYIGPFALANLDAARRRLGDVWLPYYARPDGLGFWAAIEKVSGEFLGWFVLRPALDNRFAAETEFQADEVELGYRLRQAAWGKGYATEGSRGLIRKAFLELGVPGIVSSALTTNRASWRVMEKVGLRRVGEYPLPGYDVPAVKYALRKEEFDLARRG